MFIHPNWPAPENIKAYTSTRLVPGLSQAPYDHFNLGKSVGDNPEHVSANRKLLQQILDIPQEPIWIRQTHSTIAVEATEQNRGKEADASFTNQTHQTCIILTGDCLPILLCDKQGTHIAAIHAGWRGLAKGIIEETIKTLPQLDWLVWLGPAISAAHYEVGNEVREHFSDAETAFTPSPNQPPNYWMADLYQIARIKFAKLGITQVYGGEHCTYANKNLFYSHRRDGQKAGRIATVIWRAK